VTGPPDDLLGPLLAPSRVAVVAGRGRVGQLLRDNLAGLLGQVESWPPPADDAAGPWPPGDDVVDLAVIALPAAAVPSALARIPPGRVRTAVVLAGGFAETGPDGAALQDRLVAAARSVGVRIVGPNCLGVLDGGRGLNASLGPPLPAGPRDGGVALVTQSGAYAMSAAGLLREGLPVGAVVSVGNEADVSAAELLDRLGADPGTRVLCFLLEQLRHPREFLRHARRIAPGKPVVVLRTGRSADGGRAAGSHTAALATDARLTAAALQQAGVTSVRSGQELFDVAAVLALQPLPRGARAGVVTNSGGLAVELTDLLADAGVTVPELSPALQDRLRPLLPAFGSPRNPVDVTPAWQRFATAYPRATDLLARSGEVDLVVPVLLHRAATDDGVAAGLAEVVAGLRADGVPVPVYGCWLADRDRTATRPAYRDAGIPLLDWADRTARAVGHAVHAGRVRERPPAVPVPAPRRPPVPRSGRPAGWLPPDEAAVLLAAAGVPLVAAEVCRTAQEAAASAARIGGPVAVKVVHPALVHKSDVGGVRVGVPPAEVRGVAAELLRLADGARVMVQPVVRGGPELVVGGLRDPDLGPAVAVGLGGVLVELLDDVALGLAPLDRAQARELIGSLRARAVLDGARGGSPVDRESLAALVVAVGDLLTAAPWIAEVDLNPVVGGPSGVAVVDWRVRVAPTRRGEPAGELRPPTTTKHPAAAP
jgi:acetyltransferase